MKTISPRAVGRICLASAVWVSLPARGGRFVMPVQDEAVPPGMECRDYRDDVPRPVPGETERKRGFIIFRRPLTAPVYPSTRPREFERTDRLTAFGARDQFVDLNFALYPLRPLEGLTISDSGGPGRRSLRRVVYWKVRYPQYTSKDGYRTNPEYLFPQDAPFDAPAEVPQRFLLTVRIPRDAPEGPVRGALTIACRGGEAVRLPYEIQVMPYVLKRDPAKHFSAYNYCIVRSRRHPEAKRHADDPAWQHRAAVDMFRTMVDYGFTFPPFLYLSRNAQGDAFELSGFDEFYRREMAEAGMRSPFIVAGFDWSCLHYLYEKMTGHPLTNHMVADRPVPEALYVQLEAMLVRFLEHARRNDYPEIYYGPIDEPSPGSLPMVRRIYEIFRRHGCRTYLTSPGIEMERKLGGLVDFWSDQPFRDLGEVTAADKRLYFCYPNHNSYEIKDMETMARGGRMTYGFGLWKSGYNVLIPWIWMTSNPRHLDLESTCGGNRLAPDGTTQVTTYWECFREGIIDGMYVYTLQDAIVKREPAREPALKVLLERGRRVLQDCWDAVPVMRKYLAEGHFTDEQFDGRRLEIALILRDILRHPETNDRPAPSILPDPGGRRRRQDLVAFCREQRRRGNLNERPVPFAEWRSCEKEAALSRPEPGVVRLRILVDHRKDGTEFGGKYPLGWPRMRAVFQGGDLDFNDYDFLMFRLKVDSNRDAQLAVHWPMRMDLAAGDAKSRSMLLFDRLEPGEWKTLVYPIARIRQQMNLAAKDVSRVQWMQFWIGESSYCHGDDLVFDFSDVVLVGLRTPALWKVEAADAVAASRGLIRWKLHVLGRIPDGLRLGTHLLDAAGNAAVSAEYPLKGAETADALEIRGLPPGEYTLRFDLKGRPEKPLDHPVRILPL